MVTLYGIPNCTTVKKARAWLDGRGIQYQFHDFKKQGTDDKQLAVWLEELGPVLINRQGTTWRKLGDNDKARADNPAQVIGLLAEKPSLIKRPLLDLGDRRYLGFNEERYTDIFPS